LISFSTLYNQIQQGHIQSLARAISLVENEYIGFNEFLQSLSPLPVPVIGITGPPGAGKSTLTDALIEQLAASNKKTAVLCIDPSSPFNMGALLGDRIRLSQWYNNDNVFIRSLATRGSLGGLHPKILEITELIKCAPFDYIIIETVGVGQSEIEIAGLADVTLVVLVPEAGDEIQTMKAGLMEIANIFVVNKADRPDADMFVKNLQLMLSPAFNAIHTVPIVKTIASQKQGLPQLYTEINNYLSLHAHNEKKYWLLTEKAYQLIQANRMKNINKHELKKQITNQYKQGFNLFEFVKNL
jgi:LAO/AO transport system kinase